MKNRTFLISNHILIILISTFLFQICCTEPLFAQTSSRQSTTGPNSPIVSNSKNITITIGAAKETVETLQEYLNSTIKDNQQLRKRLTDIHKKEFDSTPDEAEAWAMQFLTSMPIRKDKLISLENDRKNLSEKEKIKTSILFDYILKDFDSRILALKKYKSKIHMQVYSNYNLFVGGQTPAQFSILREVTFPTKNILKVRLDPGRVVNGLVKKYPRLNFVEIKDTKERTLLDIENLKGQGGFIMRASEVYYIDYKLDNDPINDEFKAKFSTAFDKVMEAIFLGSGETN